MGAILAALIPAITTLIERLFPDKAKQDEAKAELLRIMADANANIVASQASVVAAEAKGESWMQRNWRPLLMMSFIVIIINNFLLAPILISFGAHIAPLAMPDHMWTLLEIGVGGYIVGRSGEKIATTFNDKKFFDTLQKNSGKLSQNDVNALNTALQNAKSSEDK